MSKLKDFVKLMRPQQYYKNFLIFLSIIFSARIFEIELYFPLILGFIGLCSISSINYIINDWQDVKVDRFHPEKENRPLTSGKISNLEAFILIFILIIIVIISIFTMPINNGNRIMYTLLLSAIFLTSQFYSLYFKNQPFYDVMFISINYIWRAVTGVIVISVTLSPWLFILGYLFALFLALSKRKGDLFLLGEVNASKHKPVFLVYNHGLLNQLIVLVAGSMIVAYSIYIVEAVVDYSRGDFDYAKFENPSLMLITIPLVTLVVMRLMYFQFSGKKASRNAELLLIDKQILVIVGIVGIITFLSLYWDQLNFSSLFIDIYSNFVLSFT